MILVSCCIFCAAHFTKFSRVDLFFTLWLAKSILRMKCQQENFSGSAFWVIFIMFFKFEGRWLIWIFGQNTKAARGTNWITSEGLEGSFISERTKIVIIYCFIYFMAQDLLNNHSRTSVRAGITIQTRLSSFLSGTCLLIKYL